MVSMFDVRDAEDWLPRDRSGAIKPEVAGKVTISTFSGRGLHQFVQVSHQTTTRPRDQEGDGDLIARCGCSTVDLTGIIIMAM